MNPDALGLFSEADSDCSIRVAAVRFLGGQRYSLGTDARRRAPLNIGLGGNRCENNNDGRDRIVGRFGRARRSLCSRRYGSPPRSPPPADECSRQVTRPKGQSTYARSSRSGCVDRGPGLSTKTLPWAFFISSNEKRSYERWISMSGPLG